MSSMTTSQAANEVLRRVREIKEKEGKPLEHIIFAVAYEAGMTEEEKNKIQGTIIRLLADEVSPLYVRRREFGESRDFQDLVDQVLDSNCISKLDDRDSSLQYDYLRSLVLRELGHRGNVSRLRRLMPRKKDGKYINGDLKKKRKKE